MKISLFIDTSTKYLCVGIAKDNKVIYKVQEEALQKQSELTIPFLQKALNENGLTLNDINEVNVTIGPGSFTGIRIGMCIAKVLASMNNIPLKAISSLNAYASNGKQIVILDAKAKNITAVGGLYMLVSQAAYAVEKFIEAPVDNNKVEEIFKNLYKQKMNIALIGMPASGKTSVGKFLSEKLQKTFVDSDGEIVKAENKKIPEIFEEFGEAYFRNIEKSVIKEFSMLNSQVISTGGGVILNSENIENLKANSRIYFLDRPLDMLETSSDRPLSSNRVDLEKRYKERYELYKSSADVIIDGGKTVEEVAKIIEEDFYEYSCN